MSADPHSVSLSPGEGPNLPPEHTFEALGLIGRVVVKPRTVPGTGRGYSTHTWMEREEGTEQS